MQANQAIARLRDGLLGILKGRGELIECALVTIVAGGHLLVEGAPGLGKTLLAQGLARLLDARFKRVQCTPDLMPADIVGTKVYDARTGAFEMREGPVFCELLLADEVNRATPRTQSALLEAMQERQVTIDGETRSLPKGFCCVATQNPVEMEGTYPLPEAQLDRFLMKVRLGYPSADEETEVLRLYAEGREQGALPLEGLEPVARMEDIASLRHSAACAKAEEPILRYIASLVRATREASEVSLGASTRAGVALLGAARAKATLDGRDFVIPEDVKTLALPVLRHRIRLTPEAEMEGLDPDDAIGALLSSIEAPR
jgi:MoxR-like ATPase